MKEYQSQFSVTTMCKVLKVDRSSYYHWIAAGCVVEKIDEHLNQLIKEAFTNSRETYGTRRIRESLKQQYGLLVSLKRISSIMKSLGLVVKMKRKFRVITTDSNHNFPIAPNRLNRDFHTSFINNVYVGDITYIKTGEGWLFLATVIDLYSRKIVGWAMDQTMTVDLVNDALQMAIRRRNPEKGLIWHTDRGSQYASYQHKNLLEQHGIVQSMSRKGDCWDNAVSESFFHSLKTELIYHENFQTRAEAHMKIFEYIEIWYNRERLHSTNNYLSPADFEEQMLQKEIGM
jgi:putative transposase